VLLEALELVLVLLGSGRACLLRLLPQALPPASLA
jgi:hypothetical protein